MTEIYMQTKTIKLRICALTFLTVEKFLFNGVETFTVETSSVIEVIVY